MNKFYYHFLLSLIILVSCKTKNEIDIISQDKMVKMLLDLLDSKPNVLRFLKK